MSRPFSARFSGLAVVFILMIVPGPAWSQDTQLGADRWNRAALEWIRLLDTGAFGEAGARVDPAVPPGAMGPEQLEALWGQLGAQLGELRGVEAGRVSQRDGYHVVDLPAVFEGQSLVLQVVLSDALQVSGFFLRASEPPAYEAPAYVDQASFEEVDLTVGEDPWKLPAVLTVPTSGANLPVVVLVHGSGPNDMDETIGGSRPFRDLAWGLASKGIAVLRYDKRTNVHGPNLPSDLGLEEEVVADALFALETARERPETDPSRAFLLGHSLGGIMAPEVGRRDGNLAGIAILAAPARPFFDVLTEQLEYIGSLELDPESPARVQLDSLIQVVRSVEAGEIPDQETVLGAPPPYWRELAEVDPVATARELQTPLLVLQGGRDYQSTPQDLSVWEAALSSKLGFSSRLYPDLNHLFAPGEGKATPEEYTQGIQHVAEAVIQDLAAWISGNQ